MIQLEPATPEMFPRVLPLLETFHNAEISAERWRSLFNYSWECEESQRGFVLLDGDRVVGFFGAVLSDRIIGGRLERFANLTSWITYPEYRSQSLRLFNAVSSIPGRTLTCFTSRNELLPLYTRAGFKPLGNGILVLYPLPPIRKIAGMFSFRFTMDPHRVEKRLGEAEAKVFADHQGYRCRHLLASCAGESCYVICSRRKGRRFQFAYVHYVSNRAFFEKHIDQFRMALVIAARAPLVMIPEYLAPKQPIPLSRRSSLSYMPVFKSGTLSADAIDELYSEAILLGGF